MRNKLKKPKITVYITNYNYGKYIKQAIESVLNQSCKDFELIIIDDGSTDDSKGIIEKYSSHPKVKIIFQQNKGLNVTNNIALRVASGQYIMRLDADDYLDSSALLVMSDSLNKDDNLGLVFPDYFLIDQHDNILNIERRNSFDSEVSLLDQPAHGACTMIRKKYLQQLGGYDEEYRCQDGYELWIKFISKYKVSNINTPLFYYRQHGSNLTSNEEKILDTRAKIKDNFIKSRKLENPRVLAIIPLRGAKYSNKNISFEKLGDDFVVDIKINEAIKSTKINKVVISTPDKDIEDHISAEYSSQEKVYFHKRSEESVRLNSDLAPTINEVLSDKEIIKGKYDIIIILPIEHPFIGHKIIDDAINTLVIFNTDSLIAVRQENNMFFQHDGHGMKPILNMEKFSKLERDALYKNTGGLIALKVDHFRKEQAFISGVVGHIVIDQKSSLSLKSKLDIKIASLILNA